MTIKEQVVKDKVYYGWGSVLCHTCPSKFGHVILAEAEKGNYDNPALTILQIEQLRNVAKGHDKRFGGSHSIAVNIYEK